MAKNVVNTPRLEPDPNAQSSKKGNKNQIAQQQQQIMSMTPGFENLKAYIGTILQENNSEEILTGLVDKFLKQEQMALTAESKEEARIKKLLFGKACSEVVAYGDQQGLLYLLSDRCGYHRKY